MILVYKHVLRDSTYHRKQEAIHSLSLNQVLYCMSFTCIYDICELVVGSAVSLFLNQVVCVFFLFFVVFSFVFCTTVIPCFWFYVMCSDADMAHKRICYYFTKMWCTWIKEGQSYWEDYETIGKNLPGVDLISSLLLVTFSNCRAPLFCHVPIACSPLRL